MVKPTQLHFIEDYPFKYQEVFFVSVQVNDWDAAALEALWGWSLPSSLQDAIAKRKLEYLAGRLCVQYALRKLGIMPFELCNGQDRSPQWPAELVGSITHATYFSFVALASRGQVQGLGVDTEYFTKRRSMLGLAGQIAVEEEVAMAAYSGLSVEVFYLLLFSAKESFFKCLYPKVLKYFGFDFAKLSALHFDTADSGSFRMELLKELPPFKATFTLQGFFRIETERLHTMVVMG